MKIVDFICSEDGKLQFEESLRSEQPDRVVVAACSPRDHEATFRRCLTNAGMNPYLMQMVNIREQIAWVTEDPAMATEKAIRGHPGGGLPGAAAATAGKETAGGLPGCTGDRCRSGRYESGPGAGRSGAVGGAGGADAVYRRPAGSFRGTFPGPGVRPLHAGTADGGSAPW